MGMQYSALGDTDFSERRAVADIKVVHIDHSDAGAGTTIDIPIDAGTYICAVGTRIDEAFAGTTPTVNVGDGTTPNKFAATANIVPGTPGTFYWNPSAQAHYASAGVLRVTLGSACTAGKIAVMIQSFNLDGDWRLPAL